MFDFRNWRQLSESENLARFRRIKGYKDKHSGKYQVLASWEADTEDSLSLEVHDQSEQLTAKQQQKHEVIYATLWKVTRSLRDTQILI